MSEKTLVIDHLKLGYEGLFNPAELYNIVASLFYEKGWDWLEKMNEEVITPEGKNIRIIFEPWKNISDYYRITVRIKLHYVNLKDVEVEHEGKVVRLSHGIIRMTFDAYVISDRNGKWTDIKADEKIPSKKPFYWIVALLADRYFFRNHFEKAEAWITSDVDDLHNKIKNYLNVFKYNYQM